MWELKRREQAFYEGFPRSGSAATFERDAVDTDTIRRHRSKLAFPQLVHARLGLVEDYYELLEHMQFLQYAKAVFEGGAKVKTRAKYFTKLNTINPSTFHQSRYPVKVHERGWGYSANSSTDQETVEKIDLELVRLEARLDKHPVRGTVLEKIPIGTKPMWREYIAGMKSSGRIVRFLYESEEKRQERLEEIKDAVTARWRHVTPSDPESYKRYKGAVFGLKKEAALIGAERAAIYFVSEFERQRRQAPPLPDA